MFRCRWSRPIAAILAVWFAVVTREPAFVHVCPMHDGPAAESGEHDHHDAAGTEDPERENSCCTCIGDCDGRSTALGPSADSRSGTAVVATPSKGLPAYAYVAVAADHILPFPNGPPIRA